MAAPSDSVTGEARFDTLIADAADKLGLGTNAGPLVREVLNMIVGSPGGVAGFIKKFEAAGLGPEITPWLGRRDAPAMPSQLVDRMVGPAAIEGIASRLGVSPASASSAVAYILPKLVGTLTPGGTIPTGLAAEQTRRAPETRSTDTRVGETYARRAGEERTAERSPSTTYGSTARATEPPRHAAEVPDAPHMGRWLWPLLGALALVGLGSYLFSANRPAPTPTTTAPAPAPPRVELPTLLPRFTLSNENGLVRYSGAVNDEASRTAIVDALKTVYGADKIEGDIAVDPNRGAAPWLVNLLTALEGLNVPGVQATFDGNAVNLGGVIGEKDRDRIANSLKSTLGGGLVYGTLSDTVAGRVAEANEGVSSALAGLRQGFTGNELVGILNRSVINFPTAGSEVPAAALPLLLTAAGYIKQLPAGTVLEVSGHTDNTGDAAANVKLSQDRADAVRNVLVQAGVDPARLTAKGYGSANPIASNDLLEGRFRNRRIEYHVVRP
jgi:outer membrane protein OmpA-like peptidoglycan-associated protein